MKTIKSTITMSFDVSFLQDEVSVFETDSHLIELAYQKLCSDLEEDSSIVHNADIIEINIQNQ